MAIAPPGQTNILQRALDAANVQLTGTTPTTNTDVPQNCFKQVTAKPKIKSSGKQDDLAKLTQEIKEFTAKIKAETDCASIEVTAKALLEQGQHWTEGKIDNAIKSLKDAIKQLNLPSPDPVSIVKWIVKKVTGDALPKLEAALRAFIEVTQLVSAVADLIATLALLPKKLEACAKDFVEREKAEILNRINGYISREICKLQQEISKEIHDILQSGDSNPDGVTVGDVITDLTTAIKAFHTAQNSINVALGAVTQLVGQAQSQLTSITGGQSHIDTSSFDNMINSLNNGAATNLVNDTLVFSTQVSANNTTLPVISGTAQYGNSISVDTGTWDGDGLVYLYTWYVGDQTNSSIIPTQILGANSSTLQIPFNTIGNTIFCKVTAENNISSGWANTLSTPTITNMYIKPSAPITITGNTQTGNSVSVSIGSWTVDPLDNSANFVYTYQWVQTYSNTAVPSGTASTYSPAALDAGQTLTCWVTVANSIYGGPVTINSAASATVTSPPINTVAPVVTNIGSHVLSCTTGSWSGSPVAYQYQWYTSGGLPINGATGSVYTGTSGNYYLCSVTAMNQFAVTSANSSLVMA
jgi:hypothetical protein